MPVLACNKPTRELLLEANDTTTPTKQVTVEVPEARLAEFYAFYGRFLAGGRRGRRMGPHHSGHHCHARGQRHEQTGTPAGPVAEV
jgi:hypothetical protein